MKLLLLFVLGVLTSGNVHAIIGCNSGQSGVESTTLNRHCGQNVPRDDNSLTTPRNSSVTNGILHRDSSNRAQVMHCGECDSSLQSGFNRILDDVMCVNPGNASQPDRDCRGRFRSNTGHWSDATASPAGSIGIKRGKTMQGTLKEIVKLMKAQNGGKLNYMVISNSDSRQKTRPGYPRIALKSPNSELIVTYNTDPNSPGYNELEVMRWNGKKGKYEFQKIDFGEDGNRMNHYDNSGNYPHTPRRIPRRAAHVDLTGQTCVSCHKNPSRPNWGTYRAWAGISPPRDDMIERDPKFLNGTNPANNTASGCQTGIPAPNGSGTLACPRIDPNGEGYLNFLDQVVRARGTTSNGSASNCQTGSPSPACRLALLPVPWNPRQMNPSADGGGSTLSNSACNSATAPSNDTVAIQCIRDRVMADGYYRVPHFPEPGFQKNNAGNNVDCKTADWAGPAHAAFDQMLAQNMCQVTTNLKYNSDRTGINPNWNKYKYALAGVVSCGARSFNSLKNYLPATFHADARAHYLGAGRGQLAVSPDATRKNSTLCPSGGTRFSAGNAATDTQVFNAVKRNTQCSHIMADEYKFDGQEEYILGEFYRQNCGSNYYNCAPYSGTDTMTGISLDSERRQCVCHYRSSTGATSEIAAVPKSSMRQYAQREARRMAQTTSMAQVDGYHAIGDDGGVKGVAEGHTNEIALVRYLLEPLGIDVGKWSMVFGKNSADNSFSFSDQFLPLLRDQQIIKDVIAEVGGCSGLAARSRTAMASPRGPASAPPAALTQVQQTMQNVCTYVNTPQNNGSGNVALVTSVDAARISQLRSQATGLTSKCLDCHSHTGNRSLPRIFTNPSSSTSGNLKTWLNCSCSSNAAQCGTNNWSTGAGSACRSGYTNLDIMNRAMDPSHRTEVGISGSAMPPGGFGGNASEDPQKRQLVRLWLQAEALRGSTSTTGRITELRSLCRDIMSGLSSSSSGSTTNGSTGTGQGQ